MNLLREFVLRLLVGAEGGLPSGYHSSSGYSDAYVALTRRIDDAYPETELTSEMVAAAIKRSSTKAPAVQFALEPTAKH